MITSPFKKMLEVISGKFKVDAHFLDHQGSMLYNLSSSKVTLKQKYRILNYIFYKNIKPNETLAKLYIAPSYFCQCNCIHCYEGIKNKKKLGISMSTLEIKSIIDKAVNEIHIYHIMFCGGEVLMRKDILELIEYCHKKGLLTMVVTNGILLNEEMVNNLKKSGLTYCVISIDHPDKKTHDTLRGFNGCFDKAINGIKLLNKAGIRTGIWTYVARSNQNNLNKMRILGKKLKVNHVFVYFPFLSGKFFNKFEETLTFEEKESIRKEAKSPIFLEFPYEGTECMAGKYSMAITPNGNITPCTVVPYSYGNVKNDNLKDVLKIMKEDCKKFNKKFTGQCMVNNPEYRKNCRGKLIL